MPENVSAEQTKRLLDLPRLIREMRESCEYLEHTSLPTKCGLYEERKQDVSEAEASLSERKKAAAAAADELTAAEAKFEKDKKQLEALTAELEELLKPYDEEIARLEEECTIREGQEYTHLRAAMTCRGWSDEECRRAAKRYVEDRVDSLGLATKKEILAKLRRGEDSPGSIPTFWG